MKRIDVARRIAEEFGVGRGDADRMLFLRWLIATGRFNADLYADQVDARPAARAWTDGGIRTMGGE